MMLLVLSDCQSLLGRGRPELGETRVASSLTRSGVAAHSSRHTTATAGTFTPDTTLAPANIWEKCIFLLFEMTGGQVLKCLILIYFECWRW